jgi:hypothetical protein
MVALNDLVSEVKVIDSASPVYDRITASMNRVADAEQRMQDGLVQTDTKVQGSTRSLTAAANSFESLKRASDPVYANLQQLANAQIKLTDAVAKGVATQGEAAAIYAALKAQSDAVVAGLNSMGGAHDAVRGKASQMREAMVIVHELLSGNYKRAIGSATIELQNFGLMHTVVAAAMSPVGIAVIAATAGLLAYSVATYQVHEGQKAVADALKLTGAAAGISADGVETFAQTMGAAGDVSTKQARSISAAFIQASVSTKSWTSLAPDVKNFAELTGGDLATAQKTLAESVGGPIEKFIELDRQYNLVSDAQLQHIKNLQEQGRNVDAQALKTQALDARFSHAAETTKTWAGFFKFLGEAANQAWDALGRIGQSDPLEKQIETVKTQISYLQTQKSGLSQAGIPSIVSFLSGSASQNLENLQTLKVIQDQTAALEAHRQAMQLEGKQADELARSYDANGTEAQKLTNDIALMSKAMADGSGNADLLSRSLDIAKQKLKDIQDPTNSAWRAIQSQGRVLSAGPTNSLERAQQQAVEAATQGGKLTVPTAQLDNLRTEVAAGAQDQLNATNQELQQQAQLQKLVASAAAGTVQQQAAAQRTQVLYTEALKLGGAAMAQLVLDGKPLPPQLAQTSAALAKIDAEKLAGNINKINAEFSLSVKGSIEVARAYLEVGQAAGWEAEALKQAQTDSLRTGENVSSRQKQILSQRVADVSAAAARESDLLQQQADAQQSIADSVSKGYEAEHAARLQLQIDQATQNDATALDIAQKKGLVDVEASLAKAINDKTDAIKKSDAASSQTAAETSLRSQRESLDLLKQEVQENTGDNREHAIKIQHLKDENELKKISVGWTDNEKRQWLDNADAIAQANAQLQHQADIISTAKTLAHDVATSLYEGLTGKTSSIVDWARSTFKRVAAAAIEANIVLPVTMSIVSAMPGLFGISSAGGAGSGGDGLGSIGGSLSGLSSISDLAGGAGLISGAGISSYLFGSSSPMQLEGGAYIPSAAEEMAAVGQTTTSSGLLTSGGFQSLGLGSLGQFAGGIGGGFLAGSLLNGLAGGNSTNGMIGSGAGALGGALIGSMILPGIGTVLGGLLGGAGGGLLGGLFGPGPSVGPNSSAQVFTNNGVATAGAVGADNGGSAATAQQMQQQTIAAIQTLTSSIAGLSSLQGISVGSFGGKFFGTDQPGGGSPANATYTNAGDAIANAIEMALKDSDLSKVDPNVSKAIQNIAAGSTAQAISDDLTFATEFTPALNAMKAGITDVTQAAEIAAEATAGKLATSIETFKQKTDELGLDTQAAADATKSAVESFIGITQAQAVSPLEASVETLYGKLKGVAGLLSEVGIDQADATAKVKQQVEVMLGITQAAPAAGTFTTQLASLKQTFTDLAPILSGLGISASDAASALATAEGNLAKSANDNIQSQIDSLTGGIGTSLQNLVTTFTATFADLQAVGGNMANAQQLMALSIANLYKPETTAAIQAVNTAFQTQISIESSLASSAAKAATDLQTFITSMAVGSLSNGNPESQLAAAKRAFDQAVTNTRSSDPTVAANAEGQLTSLAQQYLTASRAYNASGSGYTTDYDYVHQQLQITEKYQETVASSATQQVTLLQEQLAAATGTQSNTKSIAEAMQELNGVMAQMNAAIRDSIAKAGGGIFTGSVTPNGSPAGVGITGNYAGTGTDSTGAAIAVETLYGTLLNRQGSSSEVGYYQKMISQGTSLDQVRQYFLNSPEYLASHSHANGGVASGWSMVGERGPEPVFFGSQAKVFSHESFRDAIGGSSNDNGALLAEVRSLRQEVASLRQVTAMGAVRTVDAISQGTAYQAQSARYATHAAAMPKAMAR